MQESKILHEVPEIVEVVRKRPGESIEDFVLRIYEHLKALKYSNIDIEIVVEIKHRHTSHPEPLLQDTYSQLNLPYLTILVKHNIVNIYLNCCAWNKT